MDGKNVVIVVLCLVVAGLLFANAGQGHGPGPSPNPVPVAAAEKAGAEAVRVFANKLSEALHEQASLARNGKFRSSADYAQWMEGRGDAAFEAAQDVMSRVVAETVGAGEWDAAEAADVSDALGTGNSKAIR